MKVWYANQFYLPVVLSAIFQMNNTTCELADLSHVLRLPDTCISIITLVYIAQFC